MRIGVYVPAAVNGLDHMVARDTGKQWDFCTRRTVCKETLLCVAHYKRAINYAHARHTLVFYSTEMSA